MAESSPSPSAKRFRVDLATTSLGPLLQDDEYEKMVLELQKEWAGKQKTAVLKLLMSGTRANRQAWLKSSNMGTILATFPCLQEGSFVSKIDHLY
jgi:hypothetical protein